MRSRFHSLTSVLVRSGAIAMVAAAILMSCTSNGVAPVLDASTMTGRWENRSGGFFRLSWDQCEFFGNQKFSCTSYPLKGDQALSFDGSWALSKNELQLHVTHDTTYIYYITGVERNSFTIDSRLSGVRTFYRVNEFN
jgi:hypothetical protein